MKKMVPWTLPNILTVSRIALIPFMVMFYYLPLPGHRLICALIFAVAAITDWIDGYVARQWQQLSAFGAFLDPVADKLIVCSALILLVAEHPFLYMMIPAMIIIGREIAISALREWMAELGNRTSVAVSMIGKFKTFLQMLAIFALLARPSHQSIFLSWCGFLSLYVATILTLWSMIVYLQAAWSHLTLPEKSE